MAFMSSWLWKACCMVCLPVGIEKGGMYCINRVGREERERHQQACSVSLKLLASVILKYATHTLLCSDITVGISLGRP